VFKELEGCNSESYWQITLVSITHTWPQTGISLGFLVPLLICIPLTSDVPRCNTTVTNLQTARTKLSVLWLGQWIEHKSKDAQAGYAKHFHNFNYEFGSFFPFVVVLKVCEIAAWDDYSFFLNTSPSFHHVLHACNFLSCNSLSSPVRFHRMHFYSLILLLLLYFVFSFPCSSGRLPYFLVFRSFAALLLSITHKATKSLINPHFRFTYHNLGMWIPT